jgi:hypothetical protein
MRKMLRFCAIAAVFFTMSNIIVGAANAQTESFRLADVQTEILKSWSRKIKDATKRFEVLDRFNDEAVLDRETQLVWERAPQDPFLPGTFSVAVEHCYARIMGGRMGWRLPTVEELTSLLVETPTANPEVIRAALPSGHPFIGIRSGNRPGSAYWSITASSASFGEGRFTVAVNEPEVSTVALETNLEAIHPTWCVRGPGGGQSSREP